MSTKNIIEITKWDLSCSWKSRTMNWMGYLGIAFLCMMLSYTTSPSTVGGLLCFMFLVFCWRAQTDLSCNLDRKTQRIAYFMLPASMQEKLLSRLIIALIITPVSILVAFLAADALAHMCRWLAGASSAPSFVGQFWHIANRAFFSSHDPEIHVNTVHINSNSIQWETSKITNILGVVFMLCSTFMCGCIWTRKAWIKQIALIIAIPFTLSLVFSMIVAYTDLENYLEHGHITVSFLNGVELVYDILLIILCIVCSWIGYRAWMRRDITESKFTFKLHRS